MINDYKILENNTVIEFNGKKYRIPDYYNKQMIAKNDEKTIEMVMISINFNPDKYILT